MLTRRGWTWVLALIGVALFGLAFYLQAQTNADNAVRELLGGRTQGSMAPWAVGGLGVLLLLIALVLVIMGSQPNRGGSVAMGWHDDPEDPTKLRYHDGTSWTAQTADKQPSS